MVKSSKGKNGKYENDIDEDCPGKLLDASWVNYLVKCKLVREPSENPTEGSYNHVRSCQRAGEHDDLVAIFEGEQSTGNSK